MDELRERAALVVQSVEERSPLAGSRPEDALFPWDLDAALGGGSVNADIYAPQSAYSAILLGVPEFRDLYSQIFNDLVCGPFNEAKLHAFLDALEPVLSDALEADPNSQLGEPVPEFFAERKAWMSQRLASVRSQIEGYVPCQPMPPPRVKLANQTPSPR